MNRLAHASTPGLGAVVRNSLFDPLMQSPKRPFLLHFSSYIVLFLFLAPSALAQAPQRPKFTNLRVGFDNFYKAGLWTSVELDLLGGSDSLVGYIALTVPDGDGIPSKVISPPCQVLPGRVTPVRLLVRIGRVEGDLQADFIVDDEVAAHKTYETALNADEDHFLEGLEDQSLLVAVGSSKMGLDEAVKLRDAASSDAVRAGRMPSEVALISNVEQLPVNWLGYESVDALAISTSNADMFRKLAPDDARLKALDQWIRMGGRLILCVGSQADEVLSPNAPLASFAPGKLEKVVTRKQTAAWETFCSSSIPLPLSKSGEKAPIQIAKIADPQGLVVAEESEDLPLVIRTPRGLGQIIFVAADLDQFPFKNWNDRGHLWAKLLDFSLSRGNDQQQPPYYSPFGYSDLSGQLRSGLDEFSGVTVIPFALVAMMIIGYLILIGPGDYFLLKKVFRRMEWTWFTFPIVVVTISFGAYWLAYYLKGNQLRSNQIDLVDLDVASHTMRGTTWLNLFSPRMESFDLSLQPREVTGQTAKNTSGYFAWMGLPGNALGGMNARGGNSSHFARPYTLWPDVSALPPKTAAMQGVPIQVWSTKSFTGRWQADAETIPQADLREEQQDLAGSITNPYSIPLNNCIVAYDRWVYEVGAIAPGETIQLGTHLKRSDLHNFLTGFGMVAGEKDAQRLETNFQMYSRDAPYTLRFMMFYEAAGGRNYTHLSNDYQSFVDLSSLLHAGRAILVADAIKNANAANQGAVLLRDGEPVSRDNDPHSVVYRFIFPVKKK